MPDYTISPKPSSLLKIQADDDFTHREALEFAYSLIKAIDLKQAYAPEAPDPLAYDPLARLARAGFRRVIGMDGEVSWHRRSERLTMVQALNMIEGERINATLGGTS